MELREVVAALEPASVDTDANAVFERVAVDPTTADSRTLFVCIEGFGLDGHDFAAEAVANGAVAVVAERRLDVGVPQVVVPDTRAALAVIADEFWRRPTEELRVVGVTGTSGKTTTAYLVHSILDAAGLRPGLFSGVEIQIGDVRCPSHTSSPSVFHLQRRFRAMLDAANATCVVEATSHYSTLRRLDRVRFAALVFTNLGHDHLDFHGTRERYFDAKRRLFINGAPPAAVNVGDAYGRRLAAELARRGHERVTTFGLADEADVRPDELVLSPAGAHIRVGELTLTTPLLGAHNVENVLAAVATARLVGASDDAICAGVARMGGVPGRMESVDAGQPFRVFVDYAHKPEALEAVLRTARAVTEGRVICVFGCGGDCYRGKRPMMGRIAAELADRTILTTDNPRDEDPLAIVADVVAGGEPDEVIADRREAIARALQLASDGDVVVVAGRGHEDAQTFEQARRVPFDDREVVRELLGATRPATAVGTPAARE
ncbi:MAG TPA: UDP-N-acetylmuramoyl-L-alanyl-D-glutamate--2,6-diaminopimelate ligase [Gaiellaceae bacterium]|nr:UDP-N-acetylmuramoyl-L-alanyl-D-glutamate--2,6-diaminopimelate ligase [Gaiellaceae bacterium]